MSREEYILNKGQIINQYKIHYLMTLFYISHIMYKNILELWLDTKGVGCYKLPTRNRNF